MRKRIASWMAVLMIFTLIGGAAHAEESTTTVTASVADVEGLRYILSAPGVSLLPDVNGGLTAPLLVTVEEVAATGANWRLTAQLAGDFSDGLGNTMSASALAMEASTVTQTLSGGDIGNKGSGTLDSARTMYEVTGQSSSSTYSGLYDSASPLVLTVPNGTTIGVYTATVTITLLSF